MPTYDYKCFSCEYESEHSHSFKVQKEFKCPDCGSIMKKIFKNFYISTGSIRQEKITKDNKKKEMQMQQELTQDYGIGTVQPDHRYIKGGVERIYNAIKKDKIKSKDHFQEVNEKNEKKSREKMIKSIEERSQKLKKNPPPPNAKNVQK